MPFDFDQYQPDSAFIETVWRTRSDRAATFTSRAVSRWELILTKREGTVTVTLKGPETKARLAPVPLDAEFIGIQFKHGAFMPRFPVDTLTDGGLQLENATDSRFWLRGSALSLPDFDHADAFVERLARTGELVRDPLVEAALNEEPLDASLRTVQRRFLKVTGLSPKTLQQIERAQRASHLLERGASIADVVYRTGYADQPHLTRSLTRLTGQTPAQLRDKPSNTSG